MTPHAIRILNPDGSLAAEIPPSGQVARVTMTSISHGEVDVLPGLKVPVFKTVYGQVAGLPAEQEACPHCGAMNCEYYAGNEPLCGCDGEPILPETYLVSMLVRQALPNRRDLFSPGDLKRDEKGQPVGCIGLVCNE